MNTITSTASLTSIRARSQGFKREGFDFESPTDRQEKLPGYEQDALRQASIALIGVGGIGTTVGLGLVRKGIGRLTVYDGDETEMSNLGRQLFFPEDLGENKAIRGARNLLQHACYPMEIAAWPMMFEDAIERGHKPKVSAAICGPDNDVARVFCAQHFLKSAPVIFVGIGKNAEHGYVFLQKPGEACFGCYKPSAVGDDRMPCPGVPAVIDILFVVAGLAMTLVDSVLMPQRKVHFNYWDVFPQGAVETKPLTVAKRPGCPICGTGGKK